MRKSPFQSRKRQQRVPRLLEMLEPRTLLSATITVNDPLTITGLTANGAVYDASGALWVYNTNYTYDTNGEPTTNAALQCVVDGATAPNLTILLDINTYAPVAFAAGANGHIYAADAYGAIDDIDPATSIITQTLLSDSAETPVAITVTGNGSVWFVGMGTDTTIYDDVDNPTYVVTVTHDSVIGRFDPTTQDVTIFTTAVTLNDSVASLISASGADSVWIGMGAMEAYGAVNALGTNRVAFASFDGTDISLTPYVVDNANLINGLVADPDGSVWYTLSNTTDSTTHDMDQPDQIVHGVISGSELVQTSYAPSGASAELSLNYNALAIDSQGNVWFAEKAGTQFGYLKDGAFTLDEKPAGTTIFQSVVNPDGSQITMLTYADVGDWPLLQIDITETTPVTFAGAANNLQALEDTTISNTLLATFTAPTPVSDYTATIAWGDNTTSTGVVTSLGDNTYAITISGKSFATQGTYAGVITVSDGTTVAGTLEFTTSIGDIPLNVTAITASPLIFRIVTAVGSFTDDGDLALSTFKATINWGDNSSSTGLIVRDPTQSGRYIVLALHQYRTRGTYTVRLTVTTTEQNAAITQSTLTTLVTAR